MIDLKKAKQAFNEYINLYENKNQAGYELKVNHTYFVAENSKQIAKSLNLSQEDIELAEVIGLLHDIGRFEELKITKEFNSVKFNHALHGSKMLFERGMIRNFVQDNQYDNIIKKAIENHSKLNIEDGLDERILLHSKIIRDADKLDNFRVKIDEKIEALFPSKIDNIEEIEISTISDNVYQAVLNKECVDIHDRKTSLDNIICVLAFTFDLNYEISYKIMKEKNYINQIIDRFKFTNQVTIKKMENIRDVVNQFIVEKISKKMKYNIKIIGDSIAAGVGSSNLIDTNELLFEDNGIKYFRRIAPNSWGNLLEKYLKEINPKYKVTNYGAGGAFSYQINKYLENLIDDKDDIILLLVGLNDRKREYGMTELKENCISIVEKIRNMNKEVIILTPTISTNENENYPNRIHHTDDVVKVIKEVAREENIKFIDVHQFIKDYLDNNKLNIENIIYGTNCKNDGIHPSDFIQKLIFMKVIKDFEKNIYITKNK